MLDFPPAPPSRRIIILVGVAVVTLLLWWARPILLPLAIAALLSFLLSPACKILERGGLPRILSVLLVVIGAFVVLAAVGWAVLNGARQLGGNIDRIYENVAYKIDHLPFRNSGTTLEKVQEKIEDVGQKLQEADAGAQTAGEDGTAQPVTGPTTGQSGPANPAEPAGEARAQPLAAAPDAESVAARNDETEADAVPVRVVPTEMTPLERTGYLIGLLAGPLGTAGLIIIFAFFILLQRDDLRDRVITLAAGQQLNLATQALDDATTRISKYLGAQAIVNGTYGLAVGAGLELISLGMKGEHFPSVWLWALLCAALRFIPYIGPWIAAAFPLIVSIGWWPDYGMFFATIGYIVVIELLSNNVMEPLLYGSSTGMSPLAVIVAAVFWTFVWGPVGLLVATPLTTCLVVLGKYVPALRFMDILLGDEPVLPPHSRLYQRLLALDAEDAEDVATAYRKEHTLTETFDDVLLPAIALAERDRHAGNLSPERVDFIRETARGIVWELAEQRAARSSDSVDDSEPTGVVPSEPTARIVLIPSVDAADQIAALMLKVLLDRRHYETTVVGEEQLISQRLEEVFAQRADVAVISALPPRAVSRARYLVKRLRQAQQQREQPTAVVVGLWTLRYDLEEAAARISEDGADVKVVTTLAEAVEQLRQRAQIVEARRTEPAGAVSSPPANISVPAR